MTKAEEFLTLGILLFPPFVYWVQLPSLLYRSHQISRVSWIKHFKLLFTSDVLSVKVAASMMISY